MSETFHADKDYFWTATREGEPVYRIHGEWYSKDDCDEAFHRVLHYIEAELELEFQKR